jgi:riboflavin kinase/FMN adenylyltransferase
MQTIDGYAAMPPESRGAVLAIGNFDGVHRGHQKLLALVREVAARRGAKPGVIVFEPHPREFFKPDVPHFRLTDIARKRELLARYGMALTVVLPFDAALAGLSADAFARRVLVDGLGVAHVVVGYDFHYGKGRAGTPETLRLAGAALGFEVTVVDQVADGGEVISSSAVREALAQGSIRRATTLLGHRWMVSGEVVGGAHRGTGMGYPTANVALHRGTALAHGIYAVEVRFDGAWHAGAAYLGTRPTFDNGDALLETFLLDFDGNLYGKTIDIAFVDFIRGDRKFADMAALVAQMDVDVAKVRAVLASAKTI